MCRMEEKGISHGNGIFAKIKKLSVSQMYSHTRWRRGNENILRNSNLAWGPWDSQTLLWGVISVKSLWKTLQQYVGKQIICSIWAVLRFLTQSCLTLCDPVDCSLPGPSVYGILRARTLEWVAMPSSRGSSQPRDRTQVSYIAGRIFTIWATREAQHISYF